MSKYILADDSVEMETFEKELTKHLIAVDPQFVLDTQKRYGIYTNRTMQLFWAAWRLARKQGMKANPLREGDHQMFFNLAQLMCKADKTHTREFLGNPYLIHQEPPAYNPRPFRYSYGNLLPPSLSILRNSTSGA